jgi:hypothetical protein
MVVEFDDTRHLADPATLKALRAEVAARARG